MQGGRLLRRRHLRVPRRRRRHDLLPRGQHPPAGRAPGHRGGLGHRPGPRAVPHRRRRGARLRRPAAARALVRVPHQRRGPGPRLPARPRRRSPCGTRRRARACASTPASRPGDVIGGNFDSLLAKLIVTGANREEALERSRRALDEFEIEGIATALPFHRAVVRDPAFATDDDDAVPRAHPLDRDRVRQPDPGRTPARRPTSPSPRSARRSPSRSAASGSRSSLPGGHRARRRRRRAAGPKKAPEAQRQEGRQRRLRRLRRRADAGHDRQGRRRGGPDGRGRRPRRRARGDEDGAAAHRAQGRHRHRPRRRGRRHRARAAPSCSRSRTEPPLFAGAAPAPGERGWRS